jgi:hypothetical protein
MTLCLRLRRHQVNDLAAPLLARLERVQLTGSALPTAWAAQLQPAGPASERKVVPAGMASATSTLRASFGPLLRTVKL